MSALARWLGLIQLAGRRTLSKAVVTERGQTLLSIFGVAIALALMLLVTSIGVGLSHDTPVLDGGVDYTIEPERSASSSVVSVDEARLGRVHAVTADLNQWSDVRTATPVLMTVLKLQSPSGQPQRLLLIGIIPPDDPRTVVGLPTNHLTTGDPFYANGSYNGTWTGEAILSQAAATNLNVTPGNHLRPTGGSAPDRTFTVTTISEARRAGIGQFPVALVHLSELQALTGGMESDVANQILVDASANIEPELAGIYPHSTVLTRGDLFRSGSSGANQLPIAISAAAFIVSVIVGTLFLMTTMGFELAAESQERSILSAIGISRSSSIAMVVMRALLIALLGAVLGIFLWLIGLLITNAIASIYLSGTQLAQFRPIFALYGIGVALLIAILTLPYLLILSRRTTGPGDLPV